MADQDAALFSSTETEKKRKKKGKGKGREGGRARAARWWTPSPAAGMEARAVAGPARESAASERMSGAREEKMD